MSFARGDLARRAALADNLAVPEPWGANDDPRVFAAIRDLRNEFRQLGITDEDGKGRLPDFLLDYEHLPPIKPTTLDRAHTRNSSATRWDQNGNLVEDSSDTLRLQRDPKTQAVEGLLYEPKRTQLHSSPSDFTTADWITLNVSITDPNSTSKAQSYYEITEGNDTNNEHVILELVSTNDGDVVAFSRIVKSKPSPNDRNFVAIRMALTDGSTTVRPRAHFDIGAGSTTKTVNINNGSVVSHEIDDLGGGWYRVKFVFNADAGFQVDTSQLALVKNDTFEYDGDGTSGIYVMHAQAEVSREVTSPILTGSATRGADAVNYGFSFPDRTTGVAYSIKDENGSTNIARATSLFGVTGAPGDIEHGVLMDRGGLNDNNADGYKQVTRNSNDTDSGGNAPEDETIDRFEYVAGTSVDDPIRLYRQIAIHTRPHTQAQKNALADQYLTQG